jgi:hypothetical protein
LQEKQEFKLVNMSFSQQSQEQYSQPETDTMVLHTQDIM